MVDQLLAQGYPVDFGHLRSQPCAICGADAEASTVDTPSCSPECLEVLTETRFPTIPPTGFPPRQPPKPFRWPRLPSTGNVSVEQALANLGTGHDVLRRHRLRPNARGWVLCPFHAERTASFQVYEKASKWQAHCQGCGWHGDMIDLEAALSDRDNKTVIREWS